MSYMGIALLAGNLVFSFANFNIYRKTGDRINLAVSILGISGAAAVFYIPVV